MIHLYTGDGKGKTTAAAGLAVRAAEEKIELTAVHDRILDRILETVQKKTCDMVILDEITYPVNWELISKEKLKRLLDSAKASQPRPVELVMTGRDPADFLLECADYVTEMRMVRHPYQKGVSARRGIEF